MMMIDIKKHTTTELHKYNHHNGYFFVRMNGSCGTISGDHLNELHEGKARIITFYKSIPHIGAVVQFIPLAQIKVVTPVMDYELEQCETLGFKFYTGHE